MTRKKLYIFFTYPISYIGGCQMYTAGKADYLQKRGWQVFVFSGGPRDAESVIPSLTQYIKQGSGMNFLYTPPYKFRRQEQGYFLNDMLERLGEISFDEYDIIVESHTDTFAYWAELFASIIGARHFFICCNEFYRSTPTLQNRFYRDNLDFFYFKWKRNEVVGDDESINKLFCGYKNVTKTLVEMPWTIREQDPIQDVDFPIEKITKLDWNICHVGRAMKDYVPFVIKGVGELARRHPDKKINFIMIGNADSLQSLLQETFQELPNVFGSLLGDMSPIPRILFSKVDVACGISQSARFVANEGVLTIVATNSDSSRTPGVLGYDTEEQIMGDGTFSYVEALENVLVKKIYAGRQYSLPQLKPAEEYYEKFWTIVNNAAPNKEYFVERLSQERVRNWTSIFPFSSIARGARIIFYGDTIITDDYRRQLDSQEEFLTEFGRNYVKKINPSPYCEVVATVDENPDEFDDSVVGVERLQVRDYDAIVICLPEDQARAAYNKICQLVPDMASKVVYNFRYLFT